MKSATCWSADPKSLSRVELEWLLRCAEGTNLLIVLLGSHAGLRVSEMTTLEWQHLDLLNGVLMVKEGKGKKAGLVALIQTLLEVLKGVGQREGFVFPCRSSQSVYERLESLCRCAKVRFKGVHVPRHSAGTRLQDETGNIVLVADYLRHLSLDTARGYAKRNHQHQSQEGHRGVGRGSCSDRREAKESDNGQK